MDGTLIIMAAIVLLIAAASVAVKSRREDVSKEQIEKLADAVDRLDIAVAKWEARKEER